MLFLWMVLACGRPEVGTCESRVCVDGYINFGDLGQHCGSVICADACEERCDDGTDNDGDGAVDCEDPQCVETCAFESERPCDDGIDGDGDGLTDCDDPDCTWTATCVYGCASDEDVDFDGDVGCRDWGCQHEAICAEHCTNDVDDDGDGRLDCDDPWCSEHPACPEHCGNGVNDDGDFDVDCDDSECFDDPSCMAGCWHGPDDDDDGFGDCYDPDCVGACVERCGDGLDNDGNGFADCWDSTCLGWYPAYCAMENASQGALYIDPWIFPRAWRERCLTWSDVDGDGLAGFHDDDCEFLEICDSCHDDDGDGLVDCEDPDCHEACNETCDDGVDDDRDGLVDCEDADCFGLPPCAEICDDNIDNDDDGLTDCLDDDCWGPGCQGATLAHVLQANLSASHASWNDHFHSDSRIVNERSFRGLVATAVTGHVQILDGYGGVEASCSWAVDTVTATRWIRRAEHTYGFPGMLRRRHVTSTAYLPAVRHGFNLDPGCPIDNSGFLPRLVPSAMGAALPVPGVGRLMRSSTSSGPEFARTWEVETLAPGPAWYHGVGGTLRSWTDDQVTYSGWSRDTFERRATRMTWSDFAPPEVSYVSTP